jgi:phosphoribosylformylglycinamidine (FGAM) synthase-like amidotransferase family enzyme
MRFGVVIFPGTWSDMDFHHVISEVLHQPVEYLWHRDTDLSRFDCLVLPGGFSYGDYLRAGAIAGRSPIVCEAGLLPGTLLRNECLQFRCQSTHVAIEQTETPFTRTLRRHQVLKMPISHGEGRYHVEREVLQRLRERNQVVFRYCTEAGQVTSAANPNGSVWNVAGVCNEDGTVLGLMPHPERAAESSVGGSTDGLLLFQSLLGSLVENGSVLGR